METVPTADDEDVDPDVDPDVDETALIAALTGVDLDFVAQVLHAADAYRRVA
jgi:hypothetical protein